MKLPIKKYKIVTGFAIIAILTTNTVLFAQDIIIKKMESRLRQRSLR